MIASKDECNKYNYFLNNSQLRNGDIVLTSSDNFFSKSIRLLTDSEYSHALMIFNQTAYIHALPKGGVQSGNIQRLFFRDKAQVCVLRLKDYEKNNNLISKACCFLRGEVAKGYNFLNAIDVKLKTGLFSKAHTKICSQLIAEAYEYAGINLVKNSINCSPEDLKRSKILEEIDIQLCCLDDMPNILSKELKKDDYQETHYQIERKAISLVRELERKEFKNIYTTKGVLDFLNENQSYNDKEITECFVNAGYFNDWTNIRDQFSYRYGDFDDFFQYLKSNITETGVTRVEIEKNVIEGLQSMAMNQLAQYNRQLEIASHNFDCTKQSFYALQKELYENLCELYKKLLDNCKYYKVTQSLP